MRRIPLACLWLTVALAFSACSPGVHAATPVYGYQVVRTYPHDPSAFTEGLFLRDGFLYESTGLEGASSIRKVVLETGGVENERSISSQFFGEGIIDWKDRLIQLTWKNQLGFVYGIDDFETKGEFHYPGEGWALTRDDRRIIMSDGTSRLRFLDPETLKETGGVTVTDEGRPVDQLNELEWVKGEIYANIWQTDRIARIDPATGKVTGWIDLTGLLPDADRARADVLNGIAYDARTDRLIVTGKLWPRLYEIKVVAKP
ncbi:glutaminyl-peptide cyclotransferase [Caulobacter sp. BK020]|uniref:glutaminyl-peptide cyclotransferase n=1 Tax=Caulobacter sp. BK020 TaxID=2512117 RepID=UPI001046C97D|nr:glutaminyl-peptide cyclotransferase [Caulobacter sp. BK020]TCS16795.1 glutamine cyclotransferase [Caulobacter sp. BK020]